MGRIQIAVRLNDWPTTPERETVTRGGLREHLVAKKNAPQLTGGSPENANDGFFIFSKAK